MYLGSKGNLFKLTTALILALTILVITGCGGGNSSAATTGGGGTTAPDITNPKPTATPLNVTVTLPTGYKMPSGGLRLSGALFDPAALNGNTATIQAWANGSEAVAAIDANGNPVLVGFIDPTHPTLDVNTTAVFLLHAAVGGFLAQESDQQTLIDGIGRSTYIPGIAADIATELAAHGNISSTTAKFRTTVNTAAELIGGTYSYTPHAIVAKPALAKSQITATHKSLNSGAPITPVNGLSFKYGDNFFILVNDQQRDILVLLDQTALVDSQGNKADAPKAVSSTEFDTTIQNGLPGITDERWGVTAQLTASPNIAVPDVPSTLSEVDYRVTGIGAGAQIGNEPLLTDAEMSTVQKFFLKSFVKRFFLPLFNRYFERASYLSYWYDYIDLGTLDAAIDAHESQIEGVLGNYPDVITSAKTGDFTEAWGNLVNDSAADHNFTVLKAMTDLYATILASTNLPDAPTGSTTRYKAIEFWVQEAIGASYSGLARAFLADYASDVQYTQFDLENTNTKVTLTPATSTVDDSGTKTLSTLTATILPKTPPTGSSYVYDWTTTGKHGDLRLGTTESTSITGVTSNTISYSSYVAPYNSDGVDTVTVKIHLKDAQGNLTLKGNATAQVTVQGRTDITLAPQKLSVKPNAVSVPIRVVPADPALLDPAHVTFVWSCTNKFGTIDAPTTASPITQTIYTAGSAEGTDTITCDYYWDGTKLASATSTVKVEKKPTIIFGEIYTHGDLSFQAIGGVRFPVQPGAKGYAVHCYDFDDLAVNVKTWDFNIGGKGEGSQDTDQNGNAVTPPGADGFYYQGWTGLFGSPGGNGDGLQGAFEYFRRRMAGMVIEVTVSY